MSSDGLSVGVDIGSRTTKIAVLRGREVLHGAIFDTTANPLPALRERLAAWDGARVTATGYGRRLLGAEFPVRIVTEIKACAAGAALVRPDCRLVLDVGGQDAKAILVGPGGGFDDFELNDRCSAGTGRFLEVMAGVLGFGLEEFWREADSAEEAVRMSSMCTVFSESEAVSLLAAGVDRRRLALGLHQAIVGRIYPLAAKFADGGEILFCGGVALNGCVVRLLGERLGRPVFVPPQPQLLAAIGAALTGGRSAAISVEPA
jgi:(R)-2-hydroxyacyl-CoA dehydratese activating ATPase